MAPSLAEMFSAAVKQLLKGEGRGGRVWSAHLNNVLFRNGTIPVMFPTIYDDYQSGRIDDPAAYDLFSGICSKICPAKKPT